MYKRLGLSLSQSLSLPAGELQSRILQNCTGSQRTALKRMTFCQQSVTQVRLRLTSTLSSFSIWHCAGTLTNGFKGSCKGSFHISALSTNDREHGHHTSIDAFREHQDVGELNVLFWCAFTMSSYCLRTKDHHRSSLRPESMKGWPMICRCINIWDR